jgi:DNA-binding transcriptional regulator YiaG
VEAATDVDDVVTARDIKRIRKALGMSYNKFARYIGVSVPTVWEWEQGTQRVSRANARLIRLLQEQGRLPQTA